MPSLREIAENPEPMRKSLASRESSIDLDHILALEQKQREAGYRVDELNAQSNALAKEYKQPGADIEKLRKQGAELKEQQRVAQEELRSLQAELDEAASWLPNLLDERVPVGSEELNQVVRTVGEPRQFDFKPLAHHELGEKLNLIDIERAVKASQSRFYFLKNEAVRLRYALIQLFLSHVLAQDFELVSTPVLAKQRTLYTSGYLPFGREDNFDIEDSDLSLIGTSEQMLLGMHMDEILDKMPLLYIGDSLCFRTEAGSYGKDTAGILRVHQFYKMEQIIYCAPEDSEYWWTRCQENEEWLLAQLEIPYQVMLLASGDLGAPAMIKYDCEGWFPSQNKYRELTSNSNLGDYQSRRGNIRFKTADGKREYPHTISATGFSDRLILAILENYQQADGSVKIPDALVQYMGGETVITAKN